MSFAAARLIAGARTLPRPFHGGEDEGNGQRSGEGTGDALRSRQRPQTKMQGRTGMQGRTENN